MKRLLSVVLVILVLLSCVSCGKTPKKGSPEETLENLESAFNERDVEKLLALFTPEIQSEFKSQVTIGNLVGGFAGFGSIFSEELINSVFGVALGSSYVEFEILSIKYNENKSEASILVLCAMGEESSFDIIEMTKIAKNWYLKSK